MRIVMVSNFMNHHQLPFSLEMLSNDAVEYIFIALEPIPKERISLGYADINHKYPFILCAYDSSENMKKAIELIVNADVAIYGSCPDNLVLLRTTKNKLCFKFSERFFKNGTGILQTPYNFLSAWKHLKKFENSSLYFGCSSAFTAADINKYTDFKGKCFKWGYFPQVEFETIEELLRKKKLFKEKSLNKSYISLLWVGRLINWKHPEVPISIAKRLKDRGCDFKLLIIGNGELESKMKNLIKDNELGKFVKLLGSMPPNEVQEYMKNSDIFLFTSDYNEGWGAVLNEAMSCGCATIASHAIGSVPYLINDGVNGLVYENGNLSSLEKKVLQLMNEEYRNKLSEQAYYTIKNIWNEKVATTRFIQLTKKILNNQSIDMMFEDGPCSRAQLLEDGWYHENEY